MKTFAIAKRVLTELSRDKRTLALMFVAPILIILLLSLIFSASSTTNTKMGVVAVPTKIEQRLDDTEHVTVKRYTTESAAKKALKTDRIDAIVQHKDNQYDLTYANVDAAQTTAAKMAFKNALTNQTITGLQQKLAQTTAALAAVTHQQPQKQQSTKQVKIINHYAYGDADTGFFNKILPILIGFFVFFFVFLISGMALLRERTSGTLDRLLATPVKRYEIVFGYMLSYGVLAIIQTLVIVLVTILILGVQVVGNIGSLVLINLLLALVALSFGILLSTFANSEFQMMQFIPIVVIPQVFFTGIIPLDSMANWVQVISYVMPIRYSGAASSAIMLRGTHLSALWPEMIVLLVFLVISTILNITGLKRYRKV
ncbi:ABC transporter permease [Latilactobacillus sakei]|uniref:ABC transporter permease n=1 Tax=Latilactobacillus sakei TaxID=1599 RepID=UPI003888E923